MAGLFPENALGSLFGGIPSNGLGRGLFAAALGPQKAPRTYPCFEMYLDDAMEWRWRFLASNYKTIADSGEGYKNIEDAKHGIALLQGCARSPTYIGRD